MKIYTNEEEYNRDLKYWGNSCGDIFNPYKFDNEGFPATIEENELPEILRDALNGDYWSDNFGTYCYLAEYKGKYGIALICEYYELAEDGNGPDINNYDHAVKFGNDLEKLYPQHTIFIGKQMGFPATISGKTDYATELVIFVDPVTTNKEDYDKLIDHLNTNAYLKYAA